MNNQDESFKYSFNSGVLKRGEIKTKIQVYCFHNDIKFEVDENKGFIESTLFYEFKGANDKIQNLKLFLEGLNNPFKACFDNSKALKIVQNYGKTLEEPIDNSIFITISGCRSESRLRNSIDDIKQAIKQILLISKDQEFRQALVDGYTSLSCFIQDEYYEKLITFLHNYDEINKKDDKKSEVLKEEGSALVEEVEKYITTTNKILGDEIYNFQIANGFS